jgi:DNA repair protein RecO (recombination protein O)
MDETRNTPALVLNRRSYREYDSLVTVFTLHSGKLNLLARGTKKTQSKLAGHIEPLTLADILIVRGKGHDYIASAITRDAYPEIRNDLNKLYYAGRALNIFSRLVKDGQADKNLFFLLADWLSSLDKLPPAPPELAPEKGELLLAFFILKLLLGLGYKPEMKNCLRCGRPIKPGGNYFDLKNGGLVDSHCGAAERPEADYQVNNFLTISDDCVKLIRYLLNNNNWSIKASPAVIKEISKIISSFITFI